MPPPLDLWHLLSQEDREKLTESNFTIGSVFKFYCKKAKKEKRLILVGFKYDKTKVAFVHINSEINENLFPTKALQNEHLKLEINDERLFLTHDSFVNCSDLIIRDAEEIRNLLHSNPIIHISSISKNDMVLIRKKIVTSKLLRTDHKKEYGLFIA